MEDNEELMIVPMQEGIRAQKLPTQVGSLLCQALEFPHPHPRIVQFRLTVARRFFSSLLASLPVQTYD
jgi:hypothetical protein